MTAATTTERQQTIVARSTQAAPERIAVLLDAMDKADQSEAQRAEQARREAAQAERKLQPYAYD